LAGQGYPGELILINFNVLFWNMNSCSGMFGKSENSQNCFGMFPAWVYVGREVWECLVSLSNSVLMFLQEFSKLFQNVPLINLCRLGGQR
jgi:hypothetical protein